MDDRLHAFVSKLIGECEGQRLALVQYLTSKAAARDWHAVQDAGSDIRELEAALDALTDVLEEIAHE